MADGDQQIKLKVNANPLDGGGFDLILNVVSQAHGPLWLLNRNWIVQQGRRRPDSEEYYRTLLCSTLTILFGPAPLPKRANVSMRNVPHLTRLDAGVTYQRTLHIIHNSYEYNPYWNIGCLPEYEYSNVEFVKVVVAYLVDLPSSILEPSDVYNDAFRSKQSIAMLADAKYQSVDVAVPETPFRWRVDQVERFEF